MRRLCSVLLLCAALGGVHALQSGTERRSHRLDVNAEGKPFEMPASEMSIQVEQSGSDIVNRPLTLEAVPLEGAGSESGGDFPSESSQGLGGSSAGSGSGSSGPTPIISQTGSYSVSCTDDAPCGSNTVQAVKIVKRLAGGGKRFGRHGTGIWSFSGGTRNERDERDQGLTAADVAAVESHDPQLAQMYKQLQTLKQKVGHDRTWVQSVQQIINHYKQKAGAVQLGIRNELNQIKQSKKAIEARKRADARKALEQRLEHVTKQLQQLQKAANSVTGETRSVQVVKSNLGRSIRAIRGEIQKLRSSRK